MNLRAHLSICAFLALSSLQGCGPDLHELRLVSVKAEIASNISRFVPLPRHAPAETLFLNVSFSTERDLIDYAKRYEYNIVSEASLCRNSEFVVATQLRNDPNVYDAAGEVTAVRNDRREGDGNRIYNLYIAVQSVPLASGPVFEYDLARDPRDICIRLRGGNMMADSFSSDTLVIPGLEVANALAHMAAR